MNRRTDTKHKYVIALFSGSECFGVVFECEEDLQEWLRLLLMYQQSEDGIDGTYKPHFGMLIFIFFLLFFPLVLPLRFSQTYGFFYEVLSKQVSTLMLTRFFFSLSFLNLIYI